MREDSEQQGLLGDEQSPNRGSIVDTLKGIIAAFTTVILHAIGATWVQLLQRRIPDLELNMFRSVAPFLMYSVYFLICRKKRAGAVCCFEFSSLFRV